MVNLGRSNGCQTCKRRRVKCDEGKPTCSRCADAGYQCPGYVTGKTIRVRFKDQTNTVSRRLHTLRGDGAPTQPSPPQTNQLSILLNPRIPEETQAFNFFLRNFVSSGRSLDSSRGLFETIIPAISSAPSSSSVSLAVSAISTLIFSKFRKDNDTKLPNQRFGQALCRLQDDLRDDSLSQSDETLLAILVLQFHENVSAILGLRKVSRTHQDGALAWMKQQDPRNFQSNTAKLLLRWVGNTDVSSSIREGRRVDSELARWIKLGNIPWSPSSSLDEIGIEVADVQYSFRQLNLQHSSCTALTCTHLPAWTKLHRLAKELERKLLVWPQLLPSHWQPRIWYPTTESIPNIYMYSDTCEIYPSIQIASIWNTWRGYRLIVLSVLASIQISILPGLSLSFLASNLRLQIIDTTLVLQRIQGLVDSVCYSVPFYLGNRIKRTALFDLEDPQLVFPSYHNLRHVNSAADGDAKPSAISKREHAHHAIAQGAWHALTPLSQLVTLLASDNGEAVYPALRKGQLDWIRKQLLRTAVLFNRNPERFQPIGFRGGMESESTNCKRALWAEQYAEVVRDGLRLTSGS